MKILVNYNREQKILYSKIKDTFQLQNVIVIKESKLKFVFILYICIYIYIYIQVVVQLLYIVTYSLIKLSFCCLIMQSLTYNKNHIIYLPYLVLGLPMIIKCNQSSLCQLSVCFITRLNVQQKKTVGLGLSLPDSFVVRGESPGCRLFATASMLEWLRNLLPHHSQGSSTERWSRNTLDTARVFYVLMCFLTSPFILNNSVETAAPFNVITHRQCYELRN